MILLFEPDLVEAMKREGVCVVSIGDFVRELRESGLIEGDQVIPKK